MSTDAKTLYGILLDRMGLSVKNGWLDEQGRVYIIFPVQEVMDALGCADNKATKLFRELEKFGLIERKRRGLGKPNLIYVKNFADPRFRNREKNGSGAADSAQQETAKSRGNKTEWNKTEGILMTMTDSRTNYGREIDALIRQVYGSKIRVFEQPVPHSVRAAEISAEGRSIFAHDPKGKVAAAYQSLTREVLADAEKQRKLGAERSR